MPHYQPATRVDGFRLPVWLFGVGLASLIFGLILWRPDHLLETVVRPQFVISEIQATNWTTRPDSDGEFTDWIEIHNPSSESQALTGWYLTDDFKELTKWRFPEIELEGEGFLVVHASGKNRRQFLDDLHTNFKLDESGEYLALVDPSGTRIVHEYLPKFPPQAGDGSFGIRSTFFENALLRGAGDFRRTAYFDQPSPGEPNRGEVWGRVSEPMISRRGGLVTSPFDVELTTRTPGAVIRYTLDGGAPSQDTGLIYRKPIRVEQTTVLRARAFGRHLKASSIATGSFLFTSDVLAQNGRELPATWGVKDGWTVPADYEMDKEITQDARYQDRLQRGLDSLPLLSVVMDQDGLFDRETGIYTHPEATGREWEREASIEFFQPGGTEFRAACGLRIQGGWSRRPEETPKHSFRLSFREQYGVPVLEFPLFGGEEEEAISSLVLRAGFNNSWLHWSAEQRKRGDLLRDEWMRRSMAALNRPSPRGRFVHLFLNGVYWGIYNACERPNADFLANAFGGSAGDYDVRDAATVPSAGDETWRQLHRIAAAAVNGDDDLEAVSEWLDLAAFIDFTVLQLLGGRSDWDVAADWYAGRRLKAGHGYHFFLWDSERTLESWDDDLTHMDGEYSPARLFQRLRQNPSFRRRFALRAREVLASDGVLGGKANRDRYRRLANGIRDAVVLESARWGDYRRDVHSFRSGPYELYDPDRHWEAEVKRVSDEYFPRRRQALQSQLERLELW